MGGERTVLVVDDEPNILMTMRMALQGGGWTVDEATTGEEALARLDQGSYAVMVLDLRLPGCDGLEVLRRMRVTHPEVRVLVISAYGTVEAAVEALVLGAADFLCKPFAHDELVRCVEEVSARDTDDERTGARFEAQLGLVRDRLAEHRYRAALEHARRAVALDPLRPEGFNLIGVCFEHLRQRLEAQRMYRVALELEPTCAPARANLDRLVMRRGGGEADLG